MTGNATVFGKCCRTTPVWRAARRIQVRNSAKIASQCRKGRDTGTALDKAAVSEVPMSTTNSETRFCTVEEQIFDMDVR